MNRPVYLYACIRRIYIVLETCGENVRGYRSKLYTAHTHTHAPTCINERTEFNKFIVQPYNSYTDGGPR